MPTLLFTSLDVLRLTLTGGVVPPGIAAAPARAGRDDRERVWLRPDGDLPRETVAGLARLGVPLLGGAADVPLKPVSCWPELIPPQPADAPTPDARPMLIVLPTDRLAPVAAEIRRLQPDAALAFRFTDSGGALLRVERCPYHTVQRPLAIFLQQSPRVWVQLGWSHPLAHVIAPTDRLALVHADGTWSWITDRPFEPENRPFALEPGRAWPDETRSMPPIPVPLRLTTDSSKSQAALWVIHEHPLEQVADLIGRAGQELAQRVSFALLEPSGRPIVLLRAEPGVGPLPVMALSGLGCRPYLNLANLYLPVGQRLEPPPRRDTARRLLAADPHRLTVLLPDGTGRFVPLRVPESAFRPLLAAIDLTCDEPPRRVTAVAFHHGLDWESFRIEEETPRARPEAAPPPERPRRSRRPGLIGRLSQALRPRSERKTRLEELTSPPNPTTRPSTPNFPPPVAEASGRRSDLMARRSTVEDEFLQALASPDPAARLSLLPDLALLNTQLGAFADAAACWLAALWQEDHPPKSWAWGWLQAERQLGRIAHGERDLASLLEAPPSPTGLRVLAAFVVWLATQEQPAPELSAQAARITRLLDEHEEWLPVRAAWLARRALAIRVDCDVLALARSRDRLLGRLHRRGLSLEQDAPSFLRFAGRGAGERFQSVREWLLRTRDTAQRWLDGLTRHRPADYLGRADGPDREGGITRALADLLLAGGLARLGEHHAARHLASAAADVLASEADPALDFLRHAFEFRLNQTLAGESADAPWPDALLARLEFVDPTGADAAVLARYRVDCLREASRVLEPAGGVAPFRVGEPAPFAREWEQALAHLPHRASPAQAAMRIERILHAPGAAEEPALVWETGLNRMVHHEPVLAREMIRRLTPALDRLPDPCPRILLAARGLELAARFDLGEVAIPLRDRLLRLFASNATRFAALLASGRSPDRRRELESLAGRAVNAWQQLDPDATSFHAAAVAWVTHGEPMTQLKRTQPETWPAALRALLHLAGGWFRRRDDAQAVAVLDLARKALLYSDLPASEKGPLACAYAAALGEAPSRMAQGRLEEMFRDLTGLYDTRLTNSHFALTPLRVIDAVVTALAGTDAPLGPIARRWLDEDEYLIRRRMQHDLRQLLR